MWLNNKILLTGKDFSLIKYLKIDLRDNKLRQFEKISTFNKILCLYADREFDSSRLSKQF